MVNCRVFAGSSHLPHLGVNVTSSVADFSSCDALSSIRECGARLLLQAKVPFDGSGSPAPHAHAVSTQPLCFSPVDGCPLVAQHILGSSVTAVVL